MNPVRRLYLYSMALLGLLASLLGLSLITYSLVINAFTASGISGGIQSLLRGPEAAWLGITPAALVLWLLHWHLANRAAGPQTLAGAEERQSPERKAFLYTGQWVASGAAAIQTGLLLAELLRRAMGAPPGSPSGWPAWAVAHLIGATLAAGAWVWLCRTVQNDGDYGIESRPARSFRRLCSYSLALASSLLAILAAVFTLYTLARGIDSGILRDLYWRSSLADYMAALLTAGGVAWLTWRQADELAITSPGHELRSISRTFATHLVLACASGLTLASAFSLLVMLFTRSQLLGSPIAPLAVSLPIGATAWIQAGRRCQRDYGADGGSARLAAARRLSRYFWAFTALVGFSIGAIELLRIVGLTAYSAQIAQDVVGPWSRFGISAAMVLVGAPAWWGHWWPQQVRSRRLDDSGASERTATSRALYLVLIATGSSAVVLYSLISGLVRLARWNSGGAVTDLRALAAAVTAAAVGLVWAVTHWLILAADRKLRAQDRLEGTGFEEEAGEAEALPAAAYPGFAAAGSISAPGAGANAGGAATDAVPPDAFRVPRRIARRSLPGAEALVSGAPATPAPSRAVCVVDGLDGAWGAALVGAIRDALPALEIWPVGLNAEAQVAMLAQMPDAMAPAVPPDALTRAGFVVGPSDILQPGALDGEVTGDLAAALADGPAEVLLLPPRSARLRWVAAPDWSLQEWVDNTVIELTNHLPSAEPGEAVT